MSDKLLSVDELIDILKKYNHRELHMHHTYSPNHSHFTGANYHELQNGMRRFHVIARGFADIAQHVTLFPDGKFLTGRDFGKNPASILGHNYGLPFCVEMVGNFDVGHDKFEGAQKQAMLQLAKYFRDRNKYIRFHNENAAKSCPGTSIVKATFLREVDEFGKAVVVVPAPKTEVASATTRATNSILENGDKGEPVKELQRKLKGFNLYGGQVDGHFGPMTEAAVEQFQRLAGVGVDGIVGPQTMKALATYKPKATVNLPLPNGVLRKGDRGESVKQLQRALKEAKFDPGAIDGKYGPATHNAVLRFQMMYRDLADDGVYGAKTKAKLVEVLR